MKRLITIIGGVLITLNLHAQIAKKIDSDRADKVAINGKPLATEPDSLFTDTIPSISFREVDIIYFRTDAERMLYYKYKSRIQKVMPYVKVAKQLYAEIQEEKETSKKKQFRKYRKDVEKEMRTKFEKELKNLSVSQGEMLFKLINRETGNNAYNIIKDVKGGATAWFYQQVGKHYGYNLKDVYDPQKEPLIEYIIKEMGPSYIAGL